MMDLVNKVVVITGGSKGLGKGLAKSFIDNGSKVIITSTNESELKLTASEIGAIGLTVDATSAEETEGLANKVVDEYGHIDIWINNAGIQIAPTTIENVSNEKLRRLFDVNYFGYFNGVQSALRAMKKNGNGIIININSTAGLSGKTGLSAYSSSKFAVKGMSESVREEIKDSRIKLFQVFPGGIQTDIYHEQVPPDIAEYMDIDYAVGKITANLTADAPDPDLIIRRPTINSDI